MWDGPRQFGRQHALNVLEIEKQHPSGITLWQPEEEANDAVDDTSDSGDSDQTADEE